MSETTLPINGVDSLNDDMIVFNDDVVRRELPMIWGSGPALYIDHNSTDPVIQIPSYGFLLGTKEALSLEFWVRFDNIDAHEFTNTIVESSRELIRFSPHSSLRLFRNQLVLTYYDDYMVAPFNRFGFPLLININYTRKGAILYVSILIDGIIVSTKILNYVQQDSETKFIYFLNDSNYKIVYGPVVMYPYNITPDMATKHFVYGQGTVTPISYKSMAGNVLTELGDRFTKRQLQTVTIPKLLSWDSGRIDNLANVDSRLTFVPRREPTTIVNKDGIERFYFSKFQDYFSSQKYGLGIRALLEDGTPDSKYVLAVIRLGKNFIVMYLKNSSICVDYKINGEEKYEQDVFVMPIATVPSGTKWDIDITLIFSQLYLVTGSKGRALIENGQTKLTIGYIDEDINSTVRTEDVELAKDYYENLKQPFQSIYAVKFLTGVNKVDEEEVLVEGACLFGPVTWYVPTQKIYQYGSWATEFPISLLTKTVQYIDEGGLEYEQEQLDYIQYNIDNFADTTSFIMIKDVTQPDIDEVIDDQLIFDNLDDLLGRYVLIKNNEILKLPEISQSQYKSLVVRTLTTISQNIVNPVIEQTFINEIRFTGATIPESFPLVTGNVTDQNIAPFERTDNMIFPKWNTDVILITPTLNMPFYYLNKQLAYKLIDDGKYDTTIWDRGFLLPKAFSDDGSDLVYGFSSFINVEDSSPITHKLMRLNYVDFQDPNQLGHLEIEWIGGGKFKIIPKPAGDYGLDVYIDYELATEHDTNKWYILTVIYKQKQIGWVDKQTKAMYLEFLSPNIYYTNANIMSVNKLSETKFVVDYYIQSDQIVKYLNSALTGSFSEMLHTNDTFDKVPVIQNAWMSAYINVMWDNVSIQSTNNI